MSLLNLHKAFDINTKHFSLKNLQLDGIFNELSKSPEVVHGPGRQGSCPAGFLILETGKNGSASEKVLHPMDPRLADEDPLTNADKVCFQLLSSLTLRTNSKKDRGQYPK